MSILASLVHINLSFGTKTIFKDAEITIHTGDRIGLLGLNGHGKSSLLKILSGELVPDISEPPFEFHKATGNGDDETKFSVFYIPQVMPFLNSDITVEEYLYVFYPELKKRLSELNDPEDWNLVNSYISYLKYFGLEKLSSKINDLSGGEQKKILLALGMSSRASLILWDEPTNHLDVETIRIFEEELLNTDQTYVLITHDRYLLNRLTNKIFHIERGTIEKFVGSYSDYLEHIAAKEEERLKLLQKLKNTLRRETEWMHQGIKARGCRSKKRVENFENLSATVQGIKAMAKRELDMTIAASNRKTKSLIEFQNVSFSYGDRKIVENASFTIHRGNKIGLLGTNGVGKTTLVKLIADKLKADTGVIKRADDLVIQYFTQKRDELDLNKSPFELLGEGEDFVHLPDGHSVHVISYFESFLFNRNDVKRPISTMSGGERNRLQMAMNLKRAGDLWIFDEPTNDLDLESLQILEQKLRDFKGTVILISHDRAFLSSVTDTVMLLKNQQIESFNGGYEQVEAYLEAINYEEMLNAQESETETPKAIDTVKENTAEKRKLTNKEKEYLKQLPKLIQETESEMESLDEQIKNFDFQDNSYEIQIKYSDLTNKFNELEEKLLQMYEDQEELST